MPIFLVPRTFLRTARNATHRD